MSQVVAAASAGGGAPKKARKERKDPPAGYCCKACGESGHWVYECSKFVPKKTKKAVKVVEEDESSDEEQDDQLRAEKRKRDAAFPDMVKCACGKRCKKRRAFVEGSGPKTFWICGFKRAKCRFSVATDAAADDVETAGGEAAEEARRRAGPPKDKINGKYIQRAAKRQASRKLFVSGIPFGGDVNARLAMFFDDHGAVGLKRVVPLKGAGGSGRFTGQAYVEFLEPEHAAKALLLSGTKLGERWLEITRVKNENDDEKPTKKKKGEEEEESSEEESSDEEDDDDDEEGEEEDDGDDDEKEEEEEEKLEDLYAIAKKPRSKKKE